jgi:hypothetical protein
MKKYISIISVALFAIGVAGCKKNYLDLEVNPNQPSVTTPQFTLAAALENATAITSNDYTEYGVWAGYLTNSGNYTPSTELQQFSFSSSDYPGPDCWDDLYANLSNLNALQTSTQSDASQANFTAIAMIMKAFDFQQLVDNFNDVPYSQAFQPSTILFPKYDKGQDVYNDLVKQLGAAISLIQKNPTAASPGTSDIIYGGDMTKWAKFANTLLLRLAIRQSNLTTNAAQAALASTASVGYIDATTEADAQPGYANSAGKISPFYANMGFTETGNQSPNNAYFRANAVDTDIMHQFKDPRAPYYWTVVPVSATDSKLVVQGNVLGSKSNLSNSYVSAVGPGLLKSPTQAQPVFTSYESYFLQAEAVARGYISGDAATLYNAGITASFTYLGLTTAQATAYEKTTAVAYPTGGTVDAQVKAIIYQKYISLALMFSNEAYAEFRRTGYPVLPQNPASADGAAVSQTLPRRLPYPLSELTNNGTNLASEGTINVFTSKVFWDTKQ